MIWCAYFRFICISIVRLCTCFNSFFPSGGILSFFFFFMFFCFIFLFHLLYFSHLNSLFSLFCCVNGDLIFARIWASVCELVCARAPSMLLLKSIFMKNVPFSRGNVRN